MLGIYVESLNTGDSTYQTFHDHCMSIGMDIEHIVAHVHTQNGLVKSLLSEQTCYIAYSTINSHSHQAKQIIINHPP